MSKTRPYRTWSRIHQKCNNPHHHGYYLYGGRGIKVCDSWKYFSKFWEDMSETYFDTATIERIDNDKGYSPDNCRWITHAEQSRNRRIVRKYPYKGRDLTIVELAKTVGMKKSTLFNRLICYKIPFERAINPKPIRRTPNPKLS